MNTAASNVFVSYSHADAALVGPIVSLLRATNTTVFRDADSIKLGKKWRQELEAAMEKADLVVVFWCRHSTDSDEVAEEYRHAMRLEKDLLPIRLDGSPLPPILSQYQTLDFSSMAGRHHMEQNRPSQPAAMSGLSIVRRLWAQISGADYRKGQNNPSRPYQHTGANAPLWQELDAAQQLMAEIIQTQVAERLLSRGRHGA